MIARHHPKNDPWGQQHQPAKTLLTGSIYSLVLIFEPKVGNGKVIVTGVDLTSRMDRRPESSQLFYSLSQHMESEGFNPEARVSADELKSMLR